MNRGFRLLSRGAVAVMAAVLIGPVAAGEFRAVVGEPGVVQAAYRVDYAQDPHLTAPFSAGATTAAWQQEKLNQINEFRSAMGVQPVTLDANLTRQVQIGVAVSTAAGEFTHNLPNEKRSSVPFVSDQDWNTAKQILLTTLGTTTPGSLVEGLIADDDADNFAGGHRTTLMSPFLTEVGVGAVPGEGGIAYEQTTPDRSTTQTFPNSGNFPAKFALGGTQTFLRWGVYTTIPFAISSRDQVQVSGTNTTTDQTGTIIGTGSSMGGDFVSATYSPYALGIRIKSGDSYKISVKVIRNGSVNFSKDYAFTLTGSVDGGEYVPDTPAAKGTVNYKAVDENGAEIAGKGGSVTGEVGKQATINAPTIAGYTLTSAGSQTVTYSKDTQTINFRYKKNANGSDSGNNGNNNGNTNPSGDINTPGETVKAFPLTAKVSRSGGTPLYSKKGSTQSPTGRTLAKDSRWKVFGAYEDSNGTTWYNVGGWVKANDVVADGPYAMTRVANQSITTVTNGSGAALYKSDYGSLVKTSRTLPKGSNWKTFEAFRDAKGVTWYNVGGWISSNDASNNAGGSTGTTASYPSVAKVNYVPGYGIRVWAKNGNSMKPLAQILPHGSRWKVSGAVNLNGATWYKVANNGWIEVKYAVKG